MIRELPLVLIAAVGAAAAAAAAARLDAQAPVATLIGRRVRLWAPTPTIGTLIRTDSTAFTLIRSDSGDTVALSRRAVRRAEISRGIHRGTAAGAKVGIGLGAFIGGIIGASTYQRPDCDPATDFLCLDFGPGLNILAGAAVGIVGGGLIGALLGSQTHVERWDRVPKKDLRITLAPGSEGVRLGVSATF
ncbi:MAG: hypothetical protein ACREL9_07800 [Gemmatimonadales bacterium]